MTAASRTPGPWYVDLYGEWGICVRSRTKSTRNIRDSQPRAAFIATRLVQADAEFIVQACNSHDELLAACEAALPALRWSLTHQPGNSVQVHDCMPLIEAAIAHTRTGPAS